MFINSANKIRKISIKNGEKEDFPIGNIGSYSYANDINFYFSAGDETINLQIGNYCSIGRNVSVMFNRNHDYLSISTSPFLNGPQKRINEKGQVIIANDVWIGDNVILLPGIFIGNGAVVGAGSVVTKDVPPYAIVAGNPSKVIKYRFDNDSIQKLLETQWWYWDFEIIQKHKELFNQDLNLFIQKLWKGRDQPPHIHFDKKKISVLFIPDFEDPFPVWKKVLIEYVRKFIEYENISLILRIPNDKKFNERLKELDELLIHFEKLPDILVLNDDLLDERSLFKDVNYFVTTRNSNMIRYLDYAKEFNVEILSGVDNPIFCLV